MKFFKLLIVPLLISVYLVLLSWPYFFSKINRFDSLGMLSLIEEKQVNISNRRVLKGEKVTSKIKSTENNFGIVLVRFIQQSAKVSDIVVFRIKREGERKWYYENTYNADQFQPNEYFTFGFPPIPNSKNIVYVFEIESLVGTYKNGVGISSRKPQVALVYKYVRKDLINYDRLSSFISKKINYVAGNVNPLENWRLTVTFILLPFLFLFMQKKKITGSYVISFLVHFKENRKKIWKIIKSNYILFQALFNIIISFLNRKGNSKKKKLNNFFNFFLSRNILVFAFFLVLIFLLFHNLFNSYFQADEWPGLAYNLPLTKDPFGFLKIMLAGDTGASIFQVQHIVFFGKEIFFLSALFFGTNFFPYAFVSLILHSLNVFFVFIFVKKLLPRKSLFAFLSAAFFAILPTQMHAITWAAIYSTSLLPTTLSLLSMISFKKAFQEIDKKFIYFSIGLLFLALFTKETSFFLFFLLPVIAYFEKRVFSLKFLGKIFLVCLVAYSLIRFIIPGIYSIQHGVQNHPKDTGTIVSRDISIYKNLPGEVLFRSLTFPFRMTGTLFLPRQTAMYVSQFVAPIILPLKSLDPSATTGGSEFFVVIYLLALMIFIFCITSILNYIKKGDKSEAQALIIALAITTLGALALVPIIFTFPRWGYDYYFDSRYYYGPSVGAAIIFPFLLFGLGKIISKSLRTKKISIVVLVIFTIWLINNLYIFNLTLNAFVNKFDSDRREVVDQLKNYLPTLSQKTVFYIETDGLSAFGTNLPFYTSVSQALTVVYYDKSPLPDSFFSKPLFDGKAQGYSYFSGRGFGYYTSKKDLSEALILGKFELSDVHAFYYESLKGKLLENTLQVRKEMEDYISKTDIADWKKLSSSSAKIKFLYPQSTQIEELRATDAVTVKSLLLKDPRFSAEIVFLNVSHAFNIADSIQFLSRQNGAPLTSLDVAEKNVYFDKYHLNKLTVTNEDQPRYFMKVNDILLYVKTEVSGPEGLKLIERILGSLEIIDEK